MVQKQYTTWGSCMQRPPGEGGHSAVYCVLEVKGSSALVLPLLSRMLPEQLAAA